MKFLLDNGLSRSAVQLLHEAGHDVQHVYDLDLWKSEDEVIFERATDEGRTIVTLDSDFHRILAIRGLSGPSVIRMRIEKLRAPELFRLLIRVLHEFEHELTSGAAITVTKDQIRCRLLPFK